MSGSIKTVKNGITIKIRIDKYLRNFLKTFGNDEEAKLDLQKIIGDHQSHKAWFDTISIVAIPAY